MGAAPRPAVNSGQEAIPNLPDADTGDRLTPAAVDGIVRLGEIWRLTSAEVCALLSDVSERLWFRKKKREWSGALSHDTLTRVSTLTGIFNGLRLQFSEPICDDWVWLPNKGALFGG